MKRLLLILFAPFSLVGGMLIGYYLHAIRLAPEFSLSTLPFDYPLLALGIVFVLVGGLLRHRTFVKNNGTSIKLREALTTKENQMDELVELNEKLTRVETAVLKVFADEKARKEQTIPATVAHYPPVDYAQSH